VVADSIVTLSLSSPTNLNNLKVNDPFTVEVSLSGLDPGQELIALPSNVSFSADLLGEPTITAGPIVPDPLSPFFLADGIPGHVDGSFLMLPPYLPDDSGHRITTNGRFYSFNVTARAVGQGEISFDLPTYFGDLFDPDNPNSPLLLTIETGPSLQFNISNSDVAVVPLPPVVFAGGLLLGLMSARRRRAPAGR
jgi:hypothetical protein